MKKGKSFLSQIYVSHLRGQLGSHLLPLYSIFSVNTRHSHYAVEEDSPISLTTALI